MWMKVVRTPEMSSDRSEVLNIQLLDAFGQLHQQTIWQLNAGDNQLTLQVEGQAAGIYFLSLSDDSGMQYKKVLIH